MRGVASGSRRESRSTCGALMKALPPARTAALALAVNGFAEWRSRWQREAMLARCCVLFPKQHSVTNIRYEQANALDEASLMVIQPRPGIVISSGFYEILLDDEMVRTSMQLNRKLLAPGGTFVFTTQVNHPQVDLMRALPNRDHESWVLKNRSVAEVEAWARTAGFSQLKTTFEESNIFSVTVAQP